MKLISILGLGIFGSSVAKTLSNFEDVEIIAVDQDERNIERVSSFVTQGVVGDITDFDLLKEIGLGDCDIVVVATGSHLESSILAIMHAKNLGVPKIVAKAKNRSYMQIYKQIGADEIIRPEKEMGEKLAHELVRRHIIDVIELDDSHSVVEFIVPDKWVGKSVEVLDLRSNYAMNVIGIRKSLEDQLNVSFRPNYVFTKGELVVAITDSKKFETADYLNKL
ncbi:MAG: TrkA family potassium uptake protein [Erysipelothrix sp.]|jgi:trk system potassium uptake protein TrkA|nr:TrkA family potassium uptake protein [Erysipelothrix sp.]